MTTLTTDGGARPGRTAAPRGRGGLLASILLHLCALAVVLRLVFPGLAPPRTAPAGVELLFDPAPQVIGGTTIPRATVADPLQAPPQMDARAAELSLAHTTATRRRPAALAVPRPAAAPLLADRPAGVAPAPAAPDSGAALAGFTTRIQQLVQQAAHYPPIARRMQVQGRVQVRFAYCNGAVSDVQIAAASQSRLLDRAAVAAVRDAAYPRPPAEIGERRLAMVVWISFTLTPDG